MKKIFCIISIWISCILLNSCVGYEPIFSSTALQFKIAKYSLNGNEQLSNQIYKKLKMISDSESEGNNTKEINISIQVFKNKKTTAKNTSGKILEYRIELKANILVKDFISNEVILEHTFDSFSSYKVQDQHSETIKLENKTTEDLVNKVFDDLLIKLSENII
jgi:hypothetical protein